MITSHFINDRERIEAIEKYYSQGFANSDSIKFLIETVKAHWKLLDEKDQEIKSLKTRYSELEEQTALTGKKNLVLHMEIEELVKMLKKVHRYQIRNPFHDAETCKACTVVAKYSPSISSTKEKI